MLFRMPTECNGEYYKPQVPDVTNSVLDICRTTTQYGHHATANPPSQHVFNLDVFETLIQKQHF